MSLSGPEWLDIKIGKLRYRSGRATKRYAMPFLRYGIAVVDRT